MTVLHDLRRRAETALDRVEYFAKDGRDMNANEVYGQRRYWKELLEDLDAAEKHLREMVLQPLDTAFDRLATEGVLYPDSQSVNFAHGHLAAFLNADNLTGGDASAVADERQMLMLLASMMEKP